MASKNELIKKLDKITDKATLIAIKNALPINLTKNTTLVGKVYITKTSNNFYNIFELNKSLLYENIVTLEIATILAQNYSHGKKSAIRELLILEKQFSKHYLDSVNYLYCIKLARKRKDYERMAILEDKLQTAKYMADHVKRGILFFKL